MQKARETNLKRDKIDKRSGMLSPPDAPLDLHARISIEAIVTGLSTLNGGDQEAIDCIAKGLSMLQDIELKLRKGIKESRRAPVGSIGDVFSFSRRQRF